MKFSKTIIFEKKFLTALRFANVGYNGSLRRLLVVVPPPFFVSAGLVAWFSRLGCLVGRRGRFAFSVGWPLVCLALVGLALVGRALVCLAGLVCLFAFRRSLAVMGHDKLGKPIVQWRDEIFSFADAPPCMMGGGHVATSSVSRQGNVCGKS